MARQQIAAQVLVQLPFTDLRGLLEADTGRSPRPAWLAGALGVTRSEADFLRGLGSLRSATPAETAGWSARHEFVRANTVLRFPDLNGELAGSATRGVVRAAKADRRFFASSFSPRAFFEIVLTLTASPDAEIPADTLIATVASLTTRLHYRANVGRPPGGRTVLVDSTMPLVACGPTMAGILGNATTRGAFRGPRDKWWISAQTPMIAVSMDRSVCRPSTRGAAVSCDEGADLRYERAEYQGVGVDVWLESVPTPQVQFVQHLSRFHSERVTLTSLAYAIAIGRLGDLRTMDREAERWNQVQLVLSEAGKYLNRDVRGKRDQQSMLAALDAELEMQADEWDELQDVLKRMRPAVTANVTKVINTTVTKIEGVIVNTGDSYDLRHAQVGVAGPNAHVGSVDVGRTGGEAAPVDVAQLARELEQLFPAVKEAANTPEELKELTAVSEAKVAADAGNGAEALGLLARAGHWTLSIAEKIGVGLAVAALKSSLGV